MQKCWYSTLSADLFSIPLPLDQILAFLSWTMSFTKLLPHSNHIAQRWHLNVITMLNDVHLPLCYHTPQRCHVHTAITLLNDVIMSFSTLLLKCYHTAERCHITHGNHTAQRQKMVNYVLSSAVQRCATLWPKLFQIYHSHWLSFVLVLRSAFAKHIYIISKQAVRPAGPACMLVDARLTLHAAMSFDPARFYSVRSPHISYATIW